MQGYRFGLVAEYLVLILYKLKFYRIVNHRMRNYAGEIDLIAIRGKNIVFIEVKARTSNLDDRFVSLKQQNRIKRAAELFLAINSKYNGYNIRFDLVIVRPYKLPNIIMNAW